MNMFKNFISALSMLALAIMLAFGQSKAGDDEVSLVLDHVVDASTYIDKIFPVHVDDTSLEDLCEQYNCANNYAKLFKTDKAHDCDIVLKSFPEGMTSDKIIAALKECGLKPATPSETLNFGLAYPEFQYMRIIALGRTMNIQGYKRVIMIDYNCVQVSRYGCTWHANVFAAVPIAASK